MMIDEDENLIVIPLSYNEQLQPQISKWVKENCFSFTHISIWPFRQSQSMTYYHFTTEEDATLFALKWA